MKKLNLILSFAVFLLADASLLAENTLFKPPFKHTYGINKGDEKKLDMLLGNATDFVDPQGIACTRRDATNKPGKDDDPELTVYGVNSGKGQIIYNKSMKALGLFGKEGRGDGEFRNPHGIFARRDGIVLVADTDNKRIQMLRHGKNGLRFDKNIGEGKLHKPWDVQLTPTDTIMVSDYMTNSIHYFDLSGRHLGEVASDKLIMPLGMDMDNKRLRKSRYHSNTIFVIDSLGKRINKLSYDSHILRRARLSDFGYPKGVVVYCALDYDNNLYLPDTVNHKIHKLDNDLRHLKSTGQYGTKDALEFNYPRGIDIWRQFGQVFISERASAQYYWLGVDIDRLEVRYYSDSLREKVDIDIFLTQKAYFDLVITGPDGFELDYCKRQRRLQQGEQNLKWDMKDESGRRVKPGIYTFEFLFEPTYSSHTFLEIPMKKKVKIPPKPDFK
ncbi:MAG: NHL repeat-containing protein [Candidatus Zixiibacteriota bacterium]